MSPFLVLQLDYIRKKVPPHQGGGKEPRWNQRVNIEVMEGREMLLVSCMNKEISGEQLIGRTEISLKEVLESGTTDAWYPLVNPKKSKPAGEVRLIMTFVPESESAEEEDANFALERYVKSQDTASSVSGDMRKKSNSTAYSDSEEIRRTEERRSSEEQVKIDRRRSRRLDSVDERNFEERRGYREPVDERNLEERRVREPRNEEIEGRINEYSRSGSDYNRNGIYRNDNEYNRNGNYRNDNEYNRNGNYRNDYKDRDNFQDYKFGYDNRSTRYDHRSRVSEDQRKIYYNNEGNDEIERNAQRYDSDRNYNGGYIEESGYSDRGYIEERNYNSRNFDERLPAEIEKPNQRYWDDDGESQQEEYSLRSNSRVINEDEETPRSMTRPLRRNNYRASEQSFGMKSLQRELAERNRSNAHRSVYEPQIERPEFGVRRNSDDQGVVINFPPPPPRKRP